MARRAIRASPRYCAGCARSRRTICWRRAEIAEFELYNLGHHVHGLRTATRSTASCLSTWCPTVTAGGVGSYRTWREAARRRPERLLVGYLPRPRHSQGQGRSGGLLVLGNANYRPEMVGLDVPHRTYVHVCGIDLVRDETGGFFVLEDNARTPSGVSYVVENRHMMSRMFPICSTASGPQCRRLRIAAAHRDDRDRALGRRRTAGRACCRRASITQRISSTFSWRARWACRWSRAGI